MFHYSNRIIPFVRPALKRALNLRPCEQLSTSRNLWDLAVPADFRNLIREMDRTIHRFERDFINHFPAQRVVPRFIPIQGLVQKDETYRVSVDVEGYKPEEIVIALKDHTLVIKGKMVRNAEDGSKYYQEFTREFSVPENVDAASLKSYLTNGELSIEAPFKPADEPKEIPISQG